MKALKFIVISAVILVAVLVFSLQAHATLQNLGIDSEMGHLYYTELGKGAGGSLLDVIWSGRIGYTDIFFAEVSGSLVSGLINISTETPNVNDKINSLSFDFSVPIGPVFFVQNTVSNTWSINESNPNFEFTSPSGLDDLGQGDQMQIYWDCIGTCPDLFDVNILYSDNGGNSYSQNVVMTPEPVSTVLFITGAATLGIRRYFKRKPA